MYTASRGIWASTGEEKETSKKEFLEILKLLEGELGDKPFFGGENFGFVDVALITFSCWFEVLETHGGFSVKEQCPKLNEWVERCMAKESVSKSLAESNKVVEFVAGLRKKFGIE